MGDFQLAPDLPTLIDRQRRERQLTPFQRLRRRVGLSSTLPRPLSPLEIEMLRPLTSGQRRHIEQQFTPPSEDIDKLINIYKAKNIKKQVENPLEVPSSLISQVQLPPHAERVRNYILILLNAIIQGKNVELKNVNNLLTLLEEELNKSVTKATATNVSQLINFERFNVSTVSQRKILRKRTSRRRTSQKKTHKRKSPKRKAPRQRKRKSPMKRKKVKYN